MEHLSVDYGQFIFQFLLITSHSSTIMQQNTLNGVRQWKTKLLHLRPNIVGQSFQSHWKMKDRLQMDWLKAILVTKGFTQVEGIDYLNFGQRCK